MPTGIVKAFYRSKGYGFIRPDNETADVFVHRNAFNPGNLRDLRKGQRVSFDVAEDQTRLVAENVRLIEDERTGPGVTLVAGRTPNIEPGDGSATSTRKPITSAVLERSLAAAVRKVAPECEAFVGVIVERVVPETVDGANWQVKGVRYGKADRDRCETALDIALREKQLKYVLVDDSGAKLL